MAQKLRDDKIGTISHSGGAITLTASSSSPSWLTIGGQQYKITSNLSRTIATDVTMAANTLYMIYAVRNAGNTQLKISSNVNSVGPAGFASWKLVGAFVTNPSAAFASIVPIDVIYVAKANSTANAQGINNGVLGNLQLGGGSLTDTFGIVRSATGTFNNATGSWSINNSFIVPQMSGKVTISVDVAWQTGGTPNFTNTWVIYPYKNSSQVSAMARNGDGGNSAGTLIFQATQVFHMWENVVAGDLLEIRAQNDGGPATLSMINRSCVIEFTASKLIRDL